MEALDVLLSMHGTEVYRDDGYWWKIEVWTVPPTRERPHGIRYNMTLHNRFNKRVFGYDNAHAVKSRKNKRFSGKRYDYDHLHRTAIDQGTPYEFQDVYTLLQDFFSGIDTTIEAIEGKIT